MPAYVRYIWSTGDMLSGNRFNNLETQYDAAMSMVATTLWPVNCIFITVSAIAPATLLGFGTWTAFGVGRVLVGYDASQAEFNLAEKTGGEKTHQLTINEMPSHTHIQDSHNHTQNAHNHNQTAHSHSLSGFNNFVDVANAGTTTPIIDNSGTFTTNGTVAVNQATTAVNQDTVAVNQNTGGDVGHNNLQPTIIVRFWKRLA